MLLSGGLDSVWALWKHLTTTDEPIRTHHVHLVNSEHRHEAEAQAMHRVLHWMHAHGYGTRIQHTESTLNFGNLRWHPRDHHAWGYWAGSILADPKNRHLTKVIRTFHMDSVTDGIDGPTRQRADAAWLTPIQFISGRTDIELEHVMLHMTKADVIRDLPPDLRALCWWCRRPRAGRPCHECHTCHQVDAVIGKNPLSYYNERSVMAPTEPQVRLVALQSFNSFEGPIRAGREFSASEGRASFLTAKGLARRIAAQGEPGPSENTKALGPSETKQTIEIVPTGGGWYTVGDQRVKGKAKAEALAASLGE